ncbi:MAG: T9SS type A sorting domain-containing protein, partial [Carboxylicivirga sp.]|nr:T9SS type A sorting domain-containing protein [Carboxylicivirga sp.]
VTDILMVECDENVHSIEISNLSGRVVYRKENKSQNMQVELSDLPSGVYNLVLVMDQQRVVKRIVKK